MHGPMIHYVNKYAGQPEMARVAARKILRNSPEWAQKLICRRGIYARKATVAFELPRRTGEIKQPGRPKMRRVVVAVGNAGDYIARLDEEDIAVPASLFEAFFEKDPVEP